MTTLIDGLTDTLDHILAGEAIEPELDSKGNVKAIPWKMSLDQANNGVVASATVNGRTYDVYANNFRVAVTKIKDVAQTPEQLMKTSPTVRKENEQTPGLMEKNVAAVAPTGSAEEKKAIEDAKVVAANAPDAKTKKEAEEVLKSSKK